MQDSNKAPTQEPTSSQGTNAGLQPGTNSGTQEVVTQEPARH